MMGRVLDGAGARAVLGSLPGAKPGPNQDAVLGIALPDGIACAVADGVSSTGEAALAAQTAVRVVLDSYVARTGGATSREALGNAAVRAHVAVREATSRVAGEGAGATTLVVAAIHRGRVGVANVGDSRAYVLPTGNGLRQVTADHSWVQERVRAGALDSRDAPTHPWRSVITRYLGGEEAPEVDTFEEELGPGDGLLLCSDGLMRALSEMEVASILTSMPPDHAVEALLSLAKQRHAYDDVTVCLVRLDPKAAGP